MKGGGLPGGGVGVSAYPFPAKRRWRGLAIAVLGLVILSMLVPLVFLLGLHNGFHNSGSLSDEQTSVRDKVQDYNQPGKTNAVPQPKQGQSVNVELIERLQPMAPKVNGSHPKELLKAKMANTTDSKGSSQAVKQSEDPPWEQHTRNTNLDTNIVKFSSSDTRMTIVQNPDDNELSCELRFGSYCLWRREYRVDMKDSMVKTLKDRLFVARAYYPSIAKLPAHDKLSQEMKQNIQEFERILSEATSDADLPFQIDRKLQKMETTIARAKSIQVECINVDKKFRQLVDLTGDEANFHMKQSSFLYQLAVHTIPKSLHCLSMRLTVEYFHSPSLYENVTSAQRYSNPSLYHVVVFSKNVLASSVVINSTVAHFRESRKLVFHVLTDQQNYFAMKLWFSRNTFEEAAVQVLNVEDHKLAIGAKSKHELSLTEEFRISFQNDLSRVAVQTIYLSMFSYSHYLLPWLFKNLNQVIVLDDDVVVQRDLSPLWAINMKGKVNGAVKNCGAKLGQLSIYLGSHSYNKKSCVWMSGVNIVDLARWRELNLSEAFSGVAAELNADRTLPMAVASRASLLVFQDLVYALDGTWVLSGLGHDYGLGRQAISEAAVLHYNGNMKPWLELGIPRYRSFWIKFLNREDVLLRDCNVIP
ncbi:putative galacturonosyltransferase 7 [Drosera capensis]